MSLRGCTAVISDLVQAYSEDLVVRQLTQLYRDEIRRVIKEIDDLLPYYREQVDVATYEFERARVMLVQAWEGEGGLDVCALEVSLKYLLKKRQVFTRILCASAEA